MEQLLREPAVERALAVAAGMLGLGLEQSTTIVQTSLPMVAHLADLDGALRARLFTASQAVLPEPIQAFYARMARNPAIRLAVVEDFVTTYGATLDDVHRAAAAVAGTTEVQARDVLAAMLPVITQTLGRVTDEERARGFSARLRALG